jgi:ABC-type multidrug transport system fused ATPase/permease subunit
MAYGDAANVCEEVLNGIRTVLAFNSQLFEIDRYRKHLKRGCKSGIWKAFFTAIFAGVFQLIMFGSMGIAFWYGTNLVLSGFISPGTVFAGNHPYSVKLIVFQFSGPYVVGPIALASLYLRSP